MDKTYFEITRQYKMLEKTIKYMELQKETLRRFYLDKKPKSIVFIGSGSSYYLSQSAEIIARTQFGFNAFSMPAGDAMVNFKSNKAAFEGSMAVAISRSGNTTEILKTVTALKDELGVPTVGITCVEDSKLGKIADLCLMMPWTFDESVCQTGTVTNLYAASALLLAGFADNSIVFDEMEKMIATGDKFVSENEPAFKDIANKQWDKVVVLADGEISGLACEGALAFKEICCTMSNYYHVLDVRHGPMVLIDKNTLIIADLKPENKEYQLGLIEDLAKKGPTIVVSTDDSYDTIKNVALHVKHENVGNIAEGLPFINVAQLIAYYKAQIKGLDAGNPDGLDAWIKL
jgi:glucosamine--fructose-6-phosphate aminotransferase (isomerizing)